VAQIRGWPGKQDTPALKDRLMIDTFRGRMRVRKWPRKRGPSKSAAVRQQNAWFKEANELAKRAHGSQIAQSMKITKGTGLYPRDLIIRAIGVGLIDVIEEDGQVSTYRQGGIEPVSFQGAIVQLAAPIAVPPNTTTVMTWTLPLKDTGLFWSVANPTRLTIPADVTIVRLTARSLERVSRNGQMIVLVAKNGAAEFGRSGFNAIAFHGESWHSGAIVVVPGDYFEMSLFMTYAGNAPAGDLTQFSIEILEAT